MRISNDKIFDNKTVNALTTASSGEVPLEHMGGYCISADYSSVGISGRIVAKASNDSTNYNIISASSQALSATGTYFYNCADVFYKSIIVDVVSAAGTVINLNMVVNTKGF